MRARLGTAAHFDAPTTLNRVARSQKVYCKGVEKATQLILGRSHTKHESCDPKSET